MTLPALRLLDNDFDFFRKFFDIQFTDKATPTFPKASIYIDSENKLTFDFALAGFSKDDITITLEDARLTVKGHKENKDESLNTAKKVFQSQIAYRDFEVVYRIPADYVVGTDETTASFQDGILTIQFEPHAAQKKASKQIEIK